MSLKNYIRDKLYLIISSIITAIIITFFLFAVKTNRAAILMVNALFWILIISILIKEYTRRKEYYVDLESTMEDTAKAIREGIFALIRPVMTSTEGRWVAITR